MTWDEKEKIAYLGEEGYGYKSIATKLSLPLDTVKSHCKRNGLAGVAKKKGPSEICRCCGRPLSQSRTGRKRKFCSDQCRNHWWKEHPQLVNRSAYYPSFCFHCGKEFVAYGHRGQKYCSHACYIAARFPKTSAQ